MTTFRACVAFDNLADDPATFVRASSAAPFLPVQLLRNPHIGRRWRSLGGEASLFLDFRARRSLDTLALVGCSMTQAGSMRLRASDTDSLAEEGVVFDRTIVGACDPAYGYHLAILAEPITARYLRIDLDEPGAAFVEAGRLFVGERHQFGVNFSYGWSVANVDPSIKTKSAGGSTFVDLRRRYRVLEVTFEHMAPDERWGFVEVLDRSKGASADVLMIRDPTAANLGQASIWGLNLDASPIAEEFFKHFAKQYRIEERL